ncbi:MAG: alanine racemase, partial [Clostridia bacterium]|nr:alanine racemase [Clostridia bacterium]
KKIKIHIKFDSGMGRLGFSCKHGQKDTPELNHAYLACTLSHLETEGVFTHFAVADEGEAGKDYTEKQCESFIGAVKWLENMGVKFEIKHAANSAAISDYKNAHLNMVRAGIVLYGENPSDKITNTLGLKPVMSLKAVISQVKLVEKGDSLSYGRTYVAEKQRKIATVPVGYADGFWRSNANGGKMAVCGKLVPVVGRVCMDQLMLDVSDIPEIEEGNLVTIMGNDNGVSVTADDLAKLNNTINYEILCAVGERVPRFYIKNGETVCIKDNIISD